MPTRGAALLGWVQDAASGAPVEGARVFLDGVPGEVAESTALGFFRLSSTMQGLHVARVERPGYVALATNVLLGGPGGTRLALALQPLPGGPGFDVRVQVNDVKTGLPLAGIPVEARRFLNAGDSAPIATHVTFTATNGSAVFRGLTNGYHDFRANHGPGGAPALPHWQPHAAAMRTNLAGSHLANFLLKPIPQSLTVQVTAFAPRAGAIGPLTNCLVELTGYSPRDTNHEVLPVRSGLSDENGRITFTDLPVMACRVIAKRPGYDPASLVILPNATGDLPATNVVLRPRFQSNELHIVLSSPAYPGRPWMFDKLPVRLQGLKGTGTEGIDWLLPTNAPATPVQFRSVTNLPPGRYRIAVNGRATNNTSYPVRPRFLGEDYVEVLPGTATFAFLNLGVAPALVRGRLHAADELSDLADLRQPIYRPRQQTGIEFVPYAPDGQLADTNIVTVNADETGAFSASLTPGRYGLRIAGLTNHWGSHVAIRDVTTTNSPRRQGWPFATLWPFPGPPPANDTPNPGTPLALESHGDYALDVFVRAQKVTLTGTVPSAMFYFDDAGHQAVFRSPTEWLAPVIDPVEPGSPFKSVMLPYHDLLLGSVTATLTPLGPGSPRMMTLPQEPEDAAKRFTFANVTPGRYSLSVTAPRHAVSNFVGLTPPFGFDEPLPVVLELPAWPSPGVLPDTDPSLGFVPPLTEWSPANLFAHYPSSDTALTVESYFWNPTEMEYVLFESFSATNFLDSFHTLIDFVSPAYAGGKVFSAPRMLAGLGWGIMPMPAGEFTYWSYLGQTNWFRATVPGPGVHTHRIYVDGPGRNISSANAPASPGYQLKLRAVSHEDPTFFVAGSIIYFGTNAPVPSTTITPTSILENYQGPAFGVVSNANWEFLGNSVTIEDPVAPRLVLTARMRRGTAVRGTVTDTNAGLPVTGARVELFSRFGQPFQAVLTQTNGDFVFPAALPSASTLFLEVTARGYKTWRQRFTPADTTLESTNPPLAAIVADVRLERLPPPLILATNLDRFGRFLPGLTKSGDQNLFTGFVAEQPLTLTWTVLAQAQVVDFTLPAFDQPDGSPGGLLSVQAADPVAEIWFIDPRSFPADRYNDPAVPALPPLTDDSRELAGWLQAIDRSQGAYANVFHQRTARFTAGPSNQVTATGKFLLSKMPPGKLLPTFAVVSGQGTVVLADYRFPTPDHQLEGVRLPPWIAAVTDMIGLSAGLQATAEELHSVVPAGRFLPLPSFTATITNTPDGFLDYRYALDVDWTEGAETPGSGLLALAPGVTGAEFKGQLVFGLGGTPPTLFLLIGASNVVHVDITKLLPKWAAQHVKESESQFLINAASLASRNFNPTNFPYEFQVTHTVQGGFTSTNAVDLGPIAPYLPYVGPIIHKLTEAGALEITGLLDANAAVNTVTTWRTLFPPAYDDEPTTTDPDRHPMRRNFLGGREGLPQTTNHFGLCFAFGAGLDIKLNALGERAGASGQLHLAGNNCPPIGPAVELSFNEFGDWPLLKRIAGEVTGEVNAFLDLWVTRLEGAWTFNLLTFAHEFSTDPFFQLIPLQVTFTNIPPWQAPPIQFLTNGQTVIPNAPRNMPLATGAGGAGGACALLLTDMNPANSNMVLKVSFLRPDGHWTTPIPIASAAGIVNSAIARLPSGQWMALWTEIAAADVLNPFPPCTLRYALGDDAGGNWSAPGQVTALSSMATLLKPLVSPSLVALAFTHTADGPLSETQSVSVASWNGSQWSAPQTLLTNAPLIGFDATASAGTNTPLALLACVESTGAAYAFGWDTQGFTGPHPIATNATRHLSLAASSSGQFHLALADQADDVRLHRYLGAGWTNVAVVVSNALVADLQLATLGHGPGSCLFLAWTESPTAAAIHYEFLTEDGAAPSAPQVLEGAGGRYRDLHVLPAGGPMAKVVARFASGSTESVRVLTVALAGPPRLANAMFVAGAFEFDLLATPERLYRIQSSSNLVDWLDIAGLNVTNSTTRIRDLQGANPDRRFYRVVAPSP